MPPQSEIFLFVLHIRKTMCHLVQTHYNIVTERFKISQCPQLFLTIKSTCKRFMNPEDVVNMTFENAQYLVKGRVT